MLNLLSSKFQKYLQLYKDDKILRDKRYNEYQNYIHNKEHINKGNFIIQQAIDNLINADMLLDDSRIIIEIEIKNILNKAVRINEFNIDDVKKEIEKKLAYICYDGNY